MCRKRGEGVTEILIYVITLEIHAQESGTMPAYHCYHIMKVICISTKLVVDTHNNKSGRKGPKNLF